MADNEAELVLRDATFKQAKNALESAGKRREAMKGIKDLASANMGMLSLLETIFTKLNGKLPATLVKIILTDKELQAAICEVMVMQFRNMLWRNWWIIAILMMVFGGILTLMFMAAVVLGGIEVTLPGDIAIRPASPASTIGSH